jgi:hypothetical protein
MRHPDKKYQQRKETLELNDSTDQMNLTDFYRVFYPARAQDTVFSAAHGTFLQIHHILGHKASINKYKQTEIPPCIMYDHNTTSNNLTTKEQHIFLNT